MCRQSCWLARVNEVIEQAFCNHPVTYALYISCHTATVSRKYHNKISLTIEKSGTWEGKHKLPRNACMDCICFLTKISIIVI